MDDMIEQCFRKIEKEEFLRIFSINKVVDAWKVTEKIKTETSLVPAQVSLSFLLFTVPNGHVNFNQNKTSQNKSSQSQNKSSQNLSLLVMYQKYLCLFFQLYRFILSQIHSPPTYNLVSYLFRLSQTPVDQAEGLC